MNDIVLDVRGLRTRFGPVRGGLVAVDGVSFSLRRGKTTALVGESGSGKSVTALSIMGLIEPPGHVVAGEVLLDGRDLRRADVREMESVRGARIGMVFQDPLTSLNPALTIGSQIAETILAHEAVSRSEAEARSVRLLEHVGVADAATRARDYPHHFSGGMRQRALIAAAIACRPDIIIADEPTTALDVTTQAEIVAIFAALRRDRGLANAGLIEIARITFSSPRCDRVCKMAANPPERVRQCMPGMTVSKTVIREKASDYEMCARLPLRNLMWLQLEKLVPDEMDGPDRGL